MKGYPVFMYEKNDCCKDMSYPQSLSSEFIYRSSAIREAIIGVLSVCVSVCLCVCVYVCVYVSLCRNAEISIATWGKAGEHKLLDTKTHETAVRHPWWYSG